LPIKFHVANSPNAHKKSLKIKMDKNTLFLGAGLVLVFLMVLAVLRMV
jgi:hypothetical protein